MTVVQTSLGKIQGLQTNGVCRFLGIPYAEPITRHSRFLPATPRSPWSGSLLATKHGSTCIQPPMPGLFARVSPSAESCGEDCLNLNIWTPDVNGSHPVLVWIHGGAYYAGSGSEEGYDGSSFAKNGVVCVTLNYRLGAQGFLDLSSFDSRFESSGCLGIADQVLALEWVRDHIADFGGDPNQVTLAGESAGAMSVSTLMTVPSAKGLFRGAIAQSGAASTVVSRETSILVTQALLEELKIDEPSALEQVSDHELLAAQIRLMTEVSESLDINRFGELTGSPMAFQPVFGTSVLPEHPLVAIERGAAKDVALMQGMTRHEAPIFFYEMADELTAEMAWEMSKPILEHGRLDKAKFKQYYHGNPLLSGLEVAGHVMSDMMFTVPILQMLAAHSKHSDSTWCYRFDWENPEFNGMLGAHHFIDVPFVFNQLDSKDARAFELHKGPKDLAKQTHLAWVAFIKYQDPNHADLPFWPPISQGGRIAMLFNEKSHMGQLCDSEVLEVWTAQS